MVSNEAIWTFTFMNLADISTTLVALQRGAYELNPVARYVINRIGLKGLFAFKYLFMGISLALVFIFNPEASEEIIWIWNAVLGIVTAWNSYVNLKILKK